MIVSSGEMVILYGLIGSPSGSDNSTGLFEEIWSGDGVLQDRPMKVTRIPNNKERIGMGRILI